MIIALICRSRDIYVLIFYLSTNCISIIWPLLVSSISSCDFVIDVRTQKVLVPPSYVYILFY